MVFVPPLAEEMNRCRRQMTVAARSLAAHGYNVVIPDLHGTGDSAGEFVAATWAGWVDDIRTVLDWLSNSGVAVAAVVGLRVGCALAAEAVAAAGVSVPRSVFWQPVFSGDAWLRQFLRIRIAGNLGSATTETVASLQARLQSGEALTVAGYRLTPELAGALADLELNRLLGAHLGETLLLTIRRSASSTRKDSETSEIRILPGAAGDVRTLYGQPFWIAGEPVVNHELIDVSIEFIRHGLTD